MSNIVILVLFILIIVLFFWGTYKTVTTGDRRYSFALLPFIVLLFVMFFM